MSDRETDDATTHRRARVASIVAAGVAIGIVFFASRGDDEPPSPTAAAVATSSFVAPARGASVDLQAPSPVIDEGAGRGGPPAETGDCGIDRGVEGLRTEADAAQSARVEATVERLIADLRGRADEPTRVTALLLQSALGAGRATDAAAQEVEAIARLATTTRDPFTYAIAWGSCQRHGKGPDAAPSCRMLSVEQWARLDPGNATPWLHAATEASARKDAAAVDEAMYRIAASTGNRIYADQLPGYAMAGVSDTASSVEKADVLAFVVGVAAAWQLPAYQTAVRYCASPLLQDSSRWQACNGVARNFVEHGSTLLEKRVGFRIGERLNWAPQKLAALRDEDDALMHVQMAPFSEAGADHCRVVERMRDFWLEAARIGEVGAARIRVEASGRSVVALAAEARADREARAKALAVEAAARPASAASGG